MKLLVLYRPQSEHSRKVEEFIHDFTKVHNKKVESVNIDTREGVAIASLYDIMQYPAVVATSESGSMLQIWTGEQLPLMNELAGYASS